MALRGLARYGLEACVERFTPGGGGAGLGGVRARSGSASRSIVDFLVLSREDGNVIPTEYLSREEGNIVPISHLHNTFPFSLL